MKILTFISFLCVFTFASSIAAKQSGDDEKAVSAVLDNLHDAASKADYKRYFNNYSTHAIFFGTDITERWTIDEFKTYTKARFEKGSGWTYKKTSRHIYFSADKKTAWFDELLMNENYGECRGTGVLILENNAWKVVQYHLTIPIPNALAREVVAMIRKQKEE